MKIFYWFLPGILWLSGTVYAQERQSAIRKNVIIKFAPLALFDTDNTFQAGIEIPVRNTKFSIQQDFGYGHASFNIWYKDRDVRPEKTILKSRTQLRYYFYQKPALQMYVAGEYLYKRVIQFDNQWVGMECGSGGCNFFENKDVKLGRLVNAIHAKLGWQFYFTNRTTIDLFTGFGIRSRNLRILTPDVDQARFKDDFSFFTDNTPNSTLILPSVAVGFHIGIILGKLKMPERQE